MEIVKLKDVCKIMNGKDLHVNLSLNKIITTIPTSMIYAKTSCFKNGYQSPPKWYVKNEYINDNSIPKLIVNNGDLIISKSCNVGEPMFIRYNNTALYRAMTLLIPNELILLKKYLFYVFKKEQKYFLDKSNGTTIKTITLEILKNFCFNLPIWNIQQQIIDIIEPFEKKLNCLSKKLSTINYIYTSMINKKHNANIMKEDGINFVKGISYNKLSIVKECGIPFINVSAINNKINTYVAFEQKELINVNYGDVILSLDGNPGLVNNFLCGVNGYGYHVKSKKYNNYEIYFSLLNERNQNIISSYSHGTTIKHATKAMNHLLIFDFKNYKNTLKKFFEYEIILKTKISILNKIINNLIELYIKN